MNKYESCSVIYVYSLMGDSTLVQILGGTITMDPTFIGKLLHKILELGFLPP